MKRQETNLKELNIKDLTLWLFYYFLEKTLFDKEIEQAYYEMFFETFFVIFFNSGTAPYITNYDVKVFGTLLLKFFSEDNFKFLKNRHHFFTPKQIEEFKLVY